MIQKLRSRLVVVASCLLGSILTTEAFATENPDTTSGKALNVTGAVRFRYEDSQWYGSATDARSFTRTSFFSFRIRPVFAYQIDPSVSFVFTPQFAKVLGRDYSYTQTDSSGASAYNESLHAHEAYLRLKISDALQVKAGRMIVSYGDQLILAAGEWPLYGRAFDGAIFSLQSEVVDVDLLGLKIESSNNLVGNDRDLSGFYSKWKIAPELKTFEVYGLYESNQVSGVNDSRSMLGVRAGLALENSFDAGLEYAAQKGTGGFLADTGTHSILVASVGYTFPEFSKLRIGYEFNQADEVWRDWYALLKGPLGRNELIGRRNLTAHALRLSFEPVENYKVRMDYWLYSRTSDQAPIYRPTDGIAAGTVAGSTSKDIGQALDLAVTQKASAAIEYGLGATLFEQGAYLKDQFGDRQLTDFYAVTYIYF